MTAIRAKANSSATTQNTTISAKRTLSDHSLNVAKANFMEAVNLRIDELMCCEGYSRDHATRTLIREIGREVNAPTETEIFQIMEVNGLGLDDAVRALIVSKAVQRSMTELGLSAIEAIDDLTAKLNIKNILNKSSTSITHQEEQEVGLKRVLRPLQPTLTKLVNRKIVAARKIKSKLIAKGIITKTTLRKRPFSNDKNEHFGRARTDSVSEEVNAKLKSTKQPSEPAGKSGNRGKGMQSCPKRPREA